MSPTSNLIYFDSDGGVTLDKVEKATTGGDLNIAALSKKTAREKEAI
jgi:hypothetical protein